MSLARELHAGQTYYITGEDFVDRHIVPGLEIIDALGGTAADRDIYALHDVPEMTGLPLSYFGRRGQPPAVVDGIGLLTHWPGQTYDRYLEKLSGSPQTAFVKDVDRGVNLAETLRLRALVSDEEYNICLQKYAGASLVLAPALDEAYRLGKPWSSFDDRPIPRNILDFVLEQASQAKEVLREHYAEYPEAPYYEPLKNVLSPIRWSGRTAVFLATGSPRPAYAS